MKSANSPWAKVSGKLSLLTIAILASTCALADDPYGYVGANLGQSRAKIDDARIATGLLGSGLTSSSISDDSRDRGYKIFGGYQVNKNFAVEVGYFDLGRFGFNATTVPTGTLSGNIRLRGLNLDAVGFLPFTEKFSAFGRIGVNYAQARDAFAGTGVVSVLNANPRQNAFNPTLGLGLQYAFSDSFALRAELERHRISDAVGNRGDIDLASVGLVYRFGAKTPAPRPRVVAPEPVVLAPAPLPVVVVAPPEPVVVMAAPAPIVPRRVSFSAESLFGFDKAVVRPEGRAALDQFTNDVRGTQYDMITVEGHTDRLGSNVYNQKLSVQRAESVKAYLVSTDRLDASKITTVGKGESTSVTRPEDCKGNKPTPALIACLQADRRVEVEVSGTR
jgi:OOP family OmpA-OmpF porin